jgi:hypothetical protein
VQRTYKEQEWTRDRAHTSLVAVGLAAASPTAVPPSLRAKELPFVFELGQRAPLPLQTEQTDRHQK